MTPKARKQRAELLPEMLNTVSWSGAILELWCSQTSKAWILFILNMQAFKKLTQLLLKILFFIHIFVSLWVLGIFHTQILNSCTKHSYRSQEQDEKGCQKKANQFPLFLTRFGHELQEFSMDLCRRSTPRMWICTSVKRSAVYAPVYSVTKPVEFSTVSW